MVAERGHFPVFRCLQPLPYSRFFQVVRPVLSRTTSSLSLSRSPPSGRTQQTPSVFHLSVSPLPFCPLRPFRFLASALTFISFRASSTLSRQLLAVDINKHLDYTVKAASTTSPDWKLEDSPIGAAAELHPTLPPPRFS